jgi:citrate lyase gamma subunit
MLVGDVAKIKQQQIIQIQFSMSSFVEKKFGDLIAQKVVQYCQF